MSVLEQITYHQGRRDEIPNQELVGELAAKENKDGILELVENLRHTDKHVQADCIKVLYEVGYLNPELIGGYAGDFLYLLEERMGVLTKPQKVLLKKLMRGLE